MSDTIHTYWYILYIPILDYFCAEDITHFKRRKTEWHVIAIKKNLKNIRPLNFFTEREEEGRQVYPLVTHDPNMLKKKSRGNLVPEGKYENFRQKQFVQYQVLRNSIKKWADWAPFSKTIEF